jgi:SAM-dependent methyltransferase
VDDNAYAGFPAQFFLRLDEEDDTRFYEPPRLVTHIDDRATAAVGELYDELAISGRVLDLMSSWVSHFRQPPQHLTVLGMNEHELASNSQANDFVVHDLNAEPRLPFADDSFDDAVCCVSVDYLTRPIDVFRDVARVLRPGGRFVCTFSNRLFPTKAIAGWRLSSDREHVAIVTAYFDRSGAYGDVTAQLRTDPRRPGDPLFAVWATVRDRPRAASG